jgi:hypothetical protein
LRTPQSLERDLIRIARTLPFPPTPPIAGQVVERLRNRALGRSRWVSWKWGAIAVLILLALLMLVPPARAAVLDFIQIGVVRILRTQNPPAPVATLPAAGRTRVPELPRTATPAPTTIPALPDLAGETTLPGAQAKLDFPILLPAYPPALNRPDRVFLQTMGSPMLVLVWLDPDHPGQARMSLDEIAAGNWSIEKYNPPVIRQVIISGQQGIWTEGPYLLQLTNGDYATERIVGGHVLIWTRGQITYRLETALSLEEAVKIAESLAPAALPTPSKATP